MSYPHRYTPFLPTNELSTPCWLFVDIFIFHRDIMCKSRVKVDKYPVNVDILKFYYFIHIYTSLSTIPVYITSYKQLYQQIVDNFIHDLFITCIWIICKSIIQWNGVSQASAFTGVNQWKQSKKIGQLSNKLSEENTVFLTFLIIHG